VAQLAESANLEEVVGAWRQAANGYGCSRAGKSGRCPCRGRAAAGRRRGVTYVVRSGARKRLDRNQHFTTIAVIDLEDRGRRSGGAEARVVEAALNPLDRNVGMSFLHMIST